MIYFVMLIVCSPISGGHLNPALTLSVFLTCGNKLDKIKKLFLMIAAQLVGGMIGLGLARFVRIDVLNDKATATRLFFPAYPLS